jgi:hypothetical protein
MASFDILLMRVRSETPTSFFFEVSKMARLMGPWLEPEAFPPKEVPLVSFFRPARLVTAWGVRVSFFGQSREGGE